MGNVHGFGYYYGAEAEQFSFYRVPRLLIKDERFKSLSSDAKLLYGLMLDRMALSVKNGWFDEENRAYVIYTIDNIREDLGCSKEKAVKVLAELDVGKGIGLVEKKRRGLGKPDIIYVMNFATKEAEKEPANTDVSTEVGKTDFKKSGKPTSRGQENRLQEVGESDSKKSENQTSGGRENRPQEVGNSDPNYNYKNNTDFSKTNPIYLSDQEEETRGPDPDRTDPMDDVNDYVQLVKANIEYEHYIDELDYQDQKLYQELFEVICEIVCVKRKSVKIGGEDYPYELVKSRFLKLNQAHLEYVMGTMKKTTTKITRIKDYMITALYNAPTTMNHYYQQEVQHDMFGDGWKEKGVV